MDDSSQSPESLQVYKQISGNRQLHKTIRTLAVCATISALAWMILTSIVKIMEQGESPWVTIAIAAMSLVFGSGPIVVMVWRFRLYMKRDHNRTIQLEMSVDAARTSSDTNPDGTTKYDE